MISKSVEYGTWTALTIPGESISCWLDESKTDFSGNVDVRLDHSSSGLPQSRASDCKRLFTPAGNGETMYLDSKNSRDVWYATCLTPGSTATVICDKGINYVRHVDANIATQANPLFSYLAMRELQTGITLTANASLDGETVTVSPGHGFTGVVGETIVIKSDDEYTQTFVTSVIGNVIGVSSPLDYPFPSGSSVIRGSVLMNVNGSVTPVDFYVRPSTSIIPIDISHCIAIIQTSTDPDDSKFGGISALTKGLFVRGYFGNHENYGTYKTNADFRSYGWDVTYYDKVLPGGGYSTVARMEPIKIFTQERRLFPNNGHYLKFTVRDNLTSLSRFTIACLGSYTSGDVDGYETIIP